MITEGSHHPSKRKRADFSLIDWALSRVKIKSWVLIESKRNSNFTAKNWYITHLAYQVIALTLGFYPVMLAMWLLWSLADSLKDQNLPSRIGTYGTIVAYKHKKVL